MILRSGYTTGSCATAAAKAATIGLLQGSIPDEVEINTPIGKKLTLEILDKYQALNTSRCAVRKDSGDDPDITNGCLIYAQVERINRDTVEIDGGEGVGRVTKPGLQTPVGSAAINPVPMHMIKDAVREITGELLGIRVEITVPNGKALAEKTFNPRLGIIDGISIIGTTGIVRPMSDDAFKTSLLCGLDIAKGLHYDTVVLVPGSLGERSIGKLIDIPKDQIVQMSNFVGFMLNAAVEKNFHTVILAGHPGKLVKLLRGDFNTHSSASKPANDLLLSILNQKSLQTLVLNLVEETTTVEGIVDILKENQLLYIVDEIAEKIETKVLEFVQDRFRVGIILFDMSSSMIGLSNTAQTWMKNSKTKSL